MEEKEVKKEKTIKFSFKALFINLYKKWKITLIVGLVALIVSFTGLFFYAKDNNTYVSNFQIEWPGIQENQYPNGRPFNYKTLISEDNLENVKAGNEDFANIDVESMYNDNGIQITEKLVEKSNSEKSFEHNYTITINQKYFGNSEQAKKFVKYLVEDLTFDAAKKEITDYQILNYFKFQDEKTQYPEIISNIDNQVKLQKQVLNSIINEASKDFIYDEKNNLSLGELQIEYDSFFKNNDYRILESELIANNYVRNEATYLEDFTNKIAAIDLQIKSNDSKIQAFKDTFNGNFGQETVPQIVANLVLENEDLKAQKSYFEKCVNNDAKYNAEFDDNVQKYQNKIIEFNQKIELAYKVVNEPKTILTYDRNQIIRSSGLGLLKTGLFSIVFTIIVELVLALILTYAIDSKKLA